MSHGAFHWHVWVDDSIFYLFTLFRVCVFDASHYSNISVDSDHTAVSGRDAIALQPSTSPRVAQNTKYCPSALATPWHCAISLLAGRTRWLSCTSRSAKAYRVVIALHESQPSLLSNRPERAAAFGQRIRKAVSACYAWRAPASYSVKTRQTRALHSSSCCFKLLALLHQYQVLKILSCCHLYCGVCPPSSARFRHTEPTTRK